MLVLVYAWLGRRAEASEVLEELMNLSKRRYVDGYHLAIVHLGLGDHQKAIDRLEKAFAAGSSSVTFLKAIQLWTRCATTPASRTSSAA